MALESCMILLDNSEYMRNGDYIPTRLEAQQDAANLLVGAKTQSNPETTVGVSAGTELLVSPTDNVGLILGALRGLEYQSRDPDVAASVQVASLALKHRRNKNGSQRIVLFVGSPLTNVETRVLTRAGRQLKKNNVSIDVVAMGEIEENEEKLRELVDAANGRVAEDGGERTCHLVTIPTGVLPSDVLASSPIIAAGGGAFAAAAAAGAADTGADGGGGFAEYGGVDPNMDPELAMALRVSMEEERARQERAAASQEASQETKTQDAQMEDATTTDEAAKEDAAPPAAAAEPTAPAMDLGLSEEEALLQQALAMSMNETEPPAQGHEQTQEVEEDSKPAAQTQEMDTEDPEDEDAAMQMALQMSMQTDEEAKTDQPQFQDPAFVNQLLGSLPGVDPNDPAIQSALSNLKDSSGESKDESSKKKDDEDENDNE